MSSPLLSWGDPFTALVDSQARRLLVLISDGDVDSGAVELKQKMESEDKVVFFSCLVKMRELFPHGNGLVQFGRGLVQCDGFK